jgi:cAMP phosphodiesterase
MKIRLLPSNLTDPAHLQPLTSFLINDKLAVDGGSIGISLAPEAQRSLRQVVVTHSHADHMATLPMFVSEVLPFLREPVEIHGTSEVIASLREHVFNNTIWPDFGQIRLIDGSAAAIRFSEVRPPEPFEASGLRLTPVWTNHTVPTIGLGIEDGDSSVVITSDTYCTDGVWELANRLKGLKAVFVDVSYPDEMAAIAEASKHLTPCALNLELAKLTADAPVYAVHLKPQFRRRTIEQLLALGRPNLRIGEIGKDYRF